MMFPRWKIFVLFAVFAIAVFPPVTAAEDDPLVRYQVGVYLESDTSAAVYPLLQVDWPTFRHKVHARWAQGYQIIDMEISPSNERFTAVFGLGAAHQQITVGATQTAFAKHLQAKTKAGYSLTDIEVTQDEHGRMRYAGVWTQLGEPRRVLLNKSYAEFIKQNATYQALGWELIDVEAAASEALTLHYSAIWQPGGQPTLFLPPSFWPEFHQAFHDLHYEGYRLVDLEQQADGRYLGVFVASCAADYLWGGRTFLGSPTGENELSGPLLGPEHLIDYEIVFDTLQGSDHPEGPQPGPDPCGFSETLFWSGPAPITLNMINEYTFQAEADELPKGLRLHNTGSAGPGN